MYDLIVIGQDVSSLVAAATAAHQGLKTALVEGKDLSDKLTLSEYVFDIDPFPWPLVDITGSYPFLRCLASNPDGALTSPDLQVVLPNHRLDFYPGKYDLMKELTRECPDNGPEIEKLVSTAIQTATNLEPQIAALSASGTFSTALKALPKLYCEGLTWRRRVNSLARNSDLKRILKAQTDLLSLTCLNGKTPLNAAYILNLSMKEAAYMAGEKWRIIAEIRQHLSDSGGGLFRDCEIERMLTGKEIEVSIQEQGRELILSAHSAILSTKWTGLDKIIHDERISNWLAQRSVKFGRSHYPFTIHLGVNEGAFPEKMAQYVILSDPDGDPAPFLGGLVFLEASAPGDLSRAPAGKRALSASVFLNTCPFENEKPQLTELAERILERVSGFLPFLRENIHIVDIEKSIEWSIGMQSRVNGKYRTGQSGLLGFSIWPVQRPKRNVVMTGGELLAGLGFAGEVLSGIQAANRISGGKSA